MNDGFAQFPRVPRHVISVWTNLAARTEHLHTPGKNSFAYEELLACARGEMFGPGNAQLPMPNMLMVDRITRITGDGGHYSHGEIQAELDIKPGLWFFDCHFPGDPVMPGCLGLDAMWQLLGFFIAWQGGLGRGRALGVNEVRFTGQVLPTAKKIDYQLDVKKVVKRGATMGIADGVMSVDGREIYFAKELRVGLFTSTSDF